LTAISLIERSARLGGPRRIRIREILRVTGSRIFDKKNRWHKVSGFFHYMKVKFSLLKNGMISAFRNCPFESSCQIKKSGECNHRGRQHPCDYECYVAKVHDLFQQINP